VIEIDGGQHAQQANYDTERDACCASRVRRSQIMNNDVLKNIDGVLEVIAKNLQNTPSSSFPARGKEVKNERNTSSPSRL